MKRSFHRLGHWIGHLTLFIFTLLELLAPAFETIQSNEASKDE
jgi:hypothetical protein